MQLQKGFYLSVLSLNLCLLTACGGGSNDTKAPTAQDETPTAPVAADTTPDSFSFTALTATELSTPVESETVTIAGINTSVDITIGQGEYSINGQAYTNQAGKINNGDTVKIKQTTSNLFATEKTSELKVGSLLVSFKTTTKVQPQVSESAPIAKIGFPLNSSSTINKAITISGTVEDSAQVLEVYVNERLVTAELVTDSNNIEQRANTGKTNYVYKWSTQVTPSDYGVYSVKVSAVNSAGQKTLQDAQSAVEIPLTFNYMDYNTNTGDIYAIHDRQLFKLNVANKTVVKLSGTRDAYDAQALFYDGEQNRVITINATGQQISVYSTVVNDDNSVTIDRLYHSTEIYGQGNVYTGAAFSSKHKKMAFSFVATDSDVSRVTELDLTNSSTSNVFETDKYKRPHQLLYTDNHLLVNSNSEINVFDVSNNNHLQKYSLTRSISHIAASSDPYSVYVLDNYTVYTLSLLNGATTTLKEFATNSQQALGQIRYVKHDGVNNRLLVQEDNVIGVTSFDLAKSEFSKYYTTGRGNGPKIVSPRKMEMNKAGTVAYVLDDGFNNVPALTKVTIATGDRETLAILDGKVRFADGIELNESKNELYLLSMNRIYHFDLTTNALTEFTSIETDHGVYMESMTEMAIKSDGNEIFVVDQIGAKLVKIDLAKKQRTLIAIARYQGSTITDISELAYRSKTNSLLIGTYGQSEVYEYSLGQSSIAKVLDACEGKFGGDLLTENTAIQSLFYHEESDSLYIQADTLMNYNFLSDYCRATGGSNVWFNLDIEIDDQGRMFTTDFNKLSQIEFLSGSSVVISQY